MGRSFSRAWEDAMRRREAKLCVSLRAVPSTVSYEAVVTLDTEPASSSLKYEVSHADATKWRGYGSM